ncbi:MAG: MarR family transcriptional regulator [Dehalococcoidales bacterium]|nr:MarR family transcriptional regulator [Dehalococcoidales bacterium]
MMRKKILDDVIHDLLSLTPLIRRSIQRKVMKSAFTKIEEDLTLPHLEIMKTLEREGTLHIAEIGDKLQIPKPQMTHLIDRLEALEIAYRQAEVHDRRITNIVLSDKGRRIVEELDLILYEGIAEKLSGLSDEELHEISDSLQKLGDILGKL